MSSFDRSGRLDPSRGMIVACVGKKRSGKSIMALTLARSWPRDLVVLDIAGDDGPAGPEVIDLSGAADELPRRWPEWRRDDRRPMIVRYAPDSGSPTHTDDMDAVVGLAWSHGDCALLVHEMGVLAPANRTPPNVRRVLMHNRHRGLTLIMAMPRPQGVDPLAIAQADLLYVFDLPNKRDRERVAETIGWDTAELTTAVAGLGPHEYLRYDANEPPPAPGQPDRRLMHFPALPADLVAQVQSWAQPSAVPTRRRR
jgi:hypothetical protein